MDYRQIAEQLLQSGQELARKGQELAEQQLQLPAEGPEREAMLKSLGQGAAAGGALAVLLGTGFGRKLTGAALKVGGLAALGTVAYDAYQRWQGHPNPAAGMPVDRLAPPEAANRSRALLRAMVAAAQADGHVDDTERARIETRLAGLDLDGDTLSLLREELGKPADVAAVAAGADSPAAAAEIYLASLLVIDETDETERAYLDALARALKLEPGLVASIEAQAKS